MATVVNFIDTTLRAAATRGVNLPTADIQLLLDSPGFHVAVDGSITPASITVTATLVDLDAPALNFNSVGGDMSNVTAKSVSVSGASMLGTSATVIASVTVNGALYTKSCTIWKVQDGAPGISTPGARGAGHYYASGSAWTDALANVSVPSPKVAGDVVTISSGTFVMEKRWTGSAWVDNGVVIDGKVIVPQSITAGSIDTRGLSIRDAAGNVILAAGSALPAAYAASGTVNADLVPSIQAAATTATLAGLDAGLGGRNMLANTLPNSLLTPDGGYSSAFADGAYGDAVAYAGPDNQYAVWSPERRGNVYFRMWGPVGARADIYLNPRYKVVARQRYEFSATISAHRCRAYVSIAWYRADGSYIIEHAGSYIDGTQWSADDKSAPPRSVVIVAAPDDAVAAMPFLRALKTSDAGSDAYAFGSQFYMGEALPNQTVASPYSMGVTEARDMAAAALVKYETLAADGVLDRGEKSSQLIPLWNDESAAWTALRARAVALGLDVSPYDGPYYAASNYLSGLYPYWNDVTNDTQIVRSDFNTIFNNLSQARSGMQSTIAAKAATMASGVTLDTNGRLLGAGGGQVQNLPVVDGARNVNYAPRDYGVCHLKEFKEANAIGIPTMPGGYCTLETMKPWIDSSGGNATQWAYVNDQTWRRTAPCGAASWGAWVRDLDRTAYTGDLNASSDIVLVGRGVVINGNAATKNTGVSQWGDADCYSVDSYYGGAYASAVVVNPAGCAFMFGLNSDVTTDASYQSLDYAIYNEYGSLYVYNSGNPYNGGQKLDSLYEGDIISVKYDSAYMYYERNGLRFLTLPAPPNLKLSLDSAFHTNGMTLKNIKFGPMSDVAAGVAAYNNIPAINNELGKRLNAEASNILRAPITITTGGGLVVGSLTYDATNGLRGSGSGVAITPYGAIAHNGTKYTFSLSGGSGDASFGGNLDAAYGSFGNLRVAPGGAICSGPFYGAWSWNGASAAGGFQISEQGILGGNRDNPNIGYFQVNFLTGEIYMPGLQVYNRQLTLDKPIILNPVLSPFKVSVVNSLNQYDYNLYRQSTDAYAGLYIATVDSGNDGATFNWAVSGPWPCWLVQDSTSNRVQLHINMKGGAALVGDEGDFNISLSVTKGGNTVQSGTFVVARAS